jgi:hypothetical protein
MDLAIDPAMYTLFDLTPLFAPLDPDDVPVYQLFATLAVIKTIN